MHNLITFIAKYVVFILPFIWLAVLLCLPRRQRLQFVAFSALSAVLTIVFVKIATSLHQDLRPFVRDHVTPYFSSSTDNGFPSDHTAFSALIAFIVMRYHRWLGVAVLLVALLIGSCRVIASVHHGQDIVGGVTLALVGVAVAWAVERLVLRFLPTAVVAFYW